jgi:hypothetical protein
MKASRHHFRNSFYMSGGYFFDKLAWRLEGLRSLYTSTLGGRVGIFPTISVDDMRLENDYHTKDLKRICLSK